ncbi:hypothetical protein [Croceibacterium aestuarii]|uniref:hypothetical protein n=1 Tax=Croceibacterium aestuarii TaxID=3064139 RepID=UPI00272EE036|nr:hypothetical protein [Croceibacterium sp. D39]
MTEFRYITRHRRGKWYSDLKEAQAQASRIGAGYLDSTGEFYAYRGTVLEFRASPAEAAEEQIRLRMASGALPHAADESASLGSGLSVA